MKPEKQDYIVACRILDIVSRSVREGTDARDAVGEEIAAVRASAMAEDMPKPRTDDVGVEYTMIDGRLVKVFPRPTEEPPYRTDFRRVDDAAREQFEAGVADLARQESGRVLLSAKIGHCYMESSVAPKKARHEAD